MQIKIYFYNFLLNLYFLFLPIFSPKFILFIFYILQFDQMSFLFYNFFRQIFLYVNILVQVNWYESILSDIIFYLNKLYNFTFSLTNCDLYLALYDQQVKNLKVHFESLKTGMTSRVKFLIPVLVSFFDIFFKDIRVTVCCSDASKYFSFFPLRHALKQTREFNNIDDYNKNQMFMCQVSS